MIYFGYWYWNLLSLLAIFADDMVANMADMQVNTTTQFVIESKSYQLLRIQVRKAKRLLVTIWRPLILLAQNFRYLSLHRWGFNLSREFSWILLRKINDIDPLLHKRRIYIRWGYWDSILLQKPLGSIKTLRRQLIITKRSQQFTDLYTNIPKSKNTNM